MFITLDKKTIKTSIGLLLATAGLMLVGSMLLTQRAGAVVDTCSWNGGGADNNFNTTGNWNCSIDGASAVPENGDTLEFDMSVPTASGQIINNDISSLSVAGINLTGSNGSSYSFNLEGNDIDINGNITGDQTDGGVALHVNVTLSGNMTYSVPLGAVTFGDSTSVGTYTLNLGANTLDVTTPTGCGFLNVYSSLAGSGNITSATGSTGINLRASSGSYTGNVTTSGDGVAVYEGALGSGNTVTINGSGRLYFATQTTYAFDVVMNSDADAALIAAYFGFACAGGGGPSTATTTLSGSLTLQRATIFQGVPHNLNVTGTFTSNSNALTTKSGSAGSITTSAGTIETEAQTTTVDASDKTTAFQAVQNKETLVLNGGRGTVQVGAGGILKGTGTAESINVFSGGTLAPGLSPGCITVTSGGLTVSGTYEVEIAGTTVCTEYDQTDVTGTVTLTGSTLNLLFLNNFVPAVNDAFVIINNDGSDTVTGEFAGLSNGSTFENNGITFRINYDGGDGNDVVLTVTAVPAVPDTGSEQILTNPLTSFIAGIATLAVIVGFRRLQKQ